MGLKLGALDEYFDPGLSFHGTGRDGVSREYTVPMPDAELGLWCVRAAQLRRRGDPAKMTPAELDELLAEVEKLPPPPGDQSLTMQERILGETHAAMVADGVPHHHVDFGFRLAMVWIITADDATVEAYYRAGGRPEAPSPANRKTRRAQAGKTNTAAASATRSRASTSGTTSPKKSQPSTAAKAAPPGRRSSSTG